MSALLSYAAMACQPQSLEALLASREDRQARQDALREKTGLPLLSMTLNLPGPCKRTPASAFFFDCQVQDLTRLLQGLGARILARDRVSRGTGDEIILAVQGLEAEALKSLALALEEASPASRLLDLDVLTAQGNPLGRAQLGLPARTCLLCDQPAFVCSRSQAHPLQAVQDKCRDLLMTFVKNRLARTLQSMALEASSFELMVAPKPGLVTPFDSGAHKDMDRFSFSRSQAALASYYVRAFELGWAGLPMADLALKLRQAGLLAQADMEAATSGVNTHRGWIYLAGILLAVAGQLCASLFRGQEVTHPLAAMSGGAADLAAALEAVLDETPHFGLLAARMNKGGGLTGIRQEALAGLPNLFDLGLPILSACRQGGMSDNQAGQRALLALLAGAYDTTLVKRAGQDQARRIRAEISQALGEEGLVKGALSLPSKRLARLMEKLSKSFDREGYSCGGAADLLAASRLVDSFQTLLVMDL